MIETSRLEDPNRMHAAYSINYQILLYISSRTVSVSTKNRLPANVGGNQCKKGRSAKETSEQWVVESWIGWFDRRTCSIGQEQ
jgi:hypothetical protein